MPPKKTEGAATATKKAAPAHASYQAMITDAIINLKDRNGSSRQSLKKYVKANNKLEGTTDAMFDSLFNKALRTGVDKGTFQQPKGASGGTKLAKKEAKPAAKKEGAAPKKPAAKKETATAKKPATKKAAAAKPAAKKASSAAKPAAKKAAAPKKAAAAPAVVDKPKAISKTKSGRVTKTTAAEPKKKTASASKKAPTKKAAAPKKEAAASS